MKRILATFVLILFVGPFLIIQHAPDTVSSVSAPSSLVVIDPGHGGWDPGAVRGNIYEKSLTLAVSLKLGELLQQQGYRVYYTRRSDTALSTTVLNDLNRRAYLANQMGGTIFVSIHVNTEPSGTAAGPIVYYRSGSQASYRLALRVTQSLRAALGVHHTPRPIRQWVLLASQMPGINVEIGFLSHNRDAIALQSSTYQMRLAQAITQGLSQYLH